MLTQLSRLSVATDGRYATEKELKPFKGYLESLELRLVVYEKIKNSADEIIDLTENGMLMVDKEIFIGPTGDYTEIWRRDTKQLLWYTAAALLFNDGDRLREGLLLWHKTLAKSYKFENTCKTCFKVMPEVIKEYLSTEEIALMRPLLALNGVVLG
jgi:hypothetical protein